MARKPNYAFERKKRAQAKAEKREAKRQARLARSKARADGSEDEQTPAPESEDRP